MDQCMVICLIVDLFDICLFSPAFCLKLHKKNLEAERFPLNQKSKELALAKAARKQECELASKSLNGNNNNGNEKNLGNAF